MSDIKMNVSCHDHGNCELCDQLEHQLALARGALIITQNNIGLIMDGSSQNRWAKLVEQTLAKLSETK